MGSQELDPDGSTPSPVSAGVMAGEGRCGDAGQAVGEAGEKQGEKNKHQESVPDERLDGIQIPIQLCDGSLVTPAFSKLEDPVLPSWSVFYRALMPVPAV